MMQVIVSSHSNTFTPLIHVPDVMTYLLQPFSSKYYNIILYPKNCL